MKFTALILSILFCFHTKLNAQYFSIREGNNKYEAGDYDEAKRLYEKVITEENKFENKKEAIFNNANTQFRQKKYAEAESDYRKLAENESIDSKLRSGAYYNIGNGYFNQAMESQGDQKESFLKDAINNYKQALRFNSNDLDAKQNLEFAKSILKQIEEEKKQNENKDKNQDTKDKNDKDNKDNKNKEDKQKQDKDKNDKDKQDQKNQDQKNQENNQQNQDQQKPDQPKPEPKEGEQGKSQISKADAEKLLDALKQDETKMLKKYLMKKSNQAKFDKDW